MRDVFEENQIHPCHKCSLSRHLLPKVNALLKTVQTVFGVVIDGPKAKKCRFGHCKMVCIITDVDLEDSLQVKKTERRQGCQEKKSPSKIITQKDECQTADSSMPMPGNNDESVTCSSTRNDLSNIDKTVEITPN